MCWSLCALKRFFHGLLLYISRGSNTNVCTTYDCRESRDLVANVWVDQTTGERALFFIFIVVLLRKSLVGMPRGCLVKEGKCLEGTIIFHVGQQIILAMCCFCLSQAQARYIGAESFF